jgi:transposase InsO family protein
VTPRPDGRKKIVTDPFGGVVGGRPGPASINETTIGKSPVAGVARAERANWEELFERSGNDMKSKSVAVLSITLYLILDVYSRKVVNFEVHETDSSDHAVDLLRRTALAEGFHTLPTKPVLHGDIGATPKVTTVLATMNWLGSKASNSRPRVSADNAFKESLFRTATYRRVARSIRYVSPR